MTMTRHWMSVRRAISIALGGGLALSMASSIGGSLRSWRRQCDTQGGCPGRRAFHRVDAHYSRGLDQAIVARGNKDECGLPHCFNDNHHVVHQPDPGVFDHCVDSKW